MERTVKVGKRIYKKTWATFCLGITYLSLMITVSCIEEVDFVEGYTVTGN